MEVEETEDEGGISGGKIQDLGRCCARCFRPEYLDKFSGMFFPIAFTVFNVAYWIYITAE